MRGLQMEENSQRRHKLRGGNDMLSRTGRDGRVLVLCRTCAEKFAVKLGISFFVRVHGIAHLTFVARGLRLASGLSEHCQRYESIKPRAHNKLHEQGTFLAHRGVAQREVVGFFC